MLQQLLQNPIFCRFLLKKKIFWQKKFKKNQKIKIGQFSISAWLEARFSSYGWKTANLGKQVYILPTGRFCAVQLCLLFIDGATGCFYLPSTSDLSSLTLNEQLRRGAVGRLFILFSQALDLFSRSTVGIFPTISFVLQMVRIFPTISFVLQMVGKSLTMDLENRSSAWEKSINSLPTAPLLSCSLSVKEERSGVEASCSSIYE